MLYFPLKIEFMRTVVQNHEKSRPKSCKNKNFLREIESCLQKNSLLCILHNNSSLNIVSVTETKCFSEKFHSTFLFKSNLCGLLCKITKKRTGDMKKAVRMEKRPSFEIFKPLLMKWIDERSEEV